MAAGTSPGNEGVRSEVAQIVANAAKERQEGASHNHHSPPPPQSPAERFAQGKIVRATLSRESLGDYSVRDDAAIALSLLAGQEVERVQSLLPLRHERMAASPFTFFRGSAIVMAHDLGQSANTGITAQLCGDAHMLNFGIFAAPDRSTVFDINDFDETHPGPFEWDLHRLFASLVLGGEDKGISHKEILAAVNSAAMQYVRSIRQYAEMSEIDIWYSRTTVSSLLQYAQSHRQPALEKAISATVQESQRKDVWSAITKFTKMTPEGRIFRTDPPILERIPMEGEIRDDIYDLYEQYKNTLPPHRRVLLDKYTILDIGHKVVGVGSVGLLAFVTLLQGRDDDDLLVLQSKQAVPSVLEPYTEPTRYAEAGQRVVMGQQIMQSASDSFLGWYAGRHGRHFYTRQLRDMKGSLSLKTLTPEVLSAYGSLCASTLARAHARSGDPLVIAGYLGRGNIAAQGFVDHAFAYRNQVHLDYRAFLGARESK